MPCDGEVQRITKLHHLAQFLQAVIDAVQEAVILSPLFARVFCRDDGEEEERAFLPVAVRYFLQYRFPGNGDFLAGKMLAVGELSVPDVPFCQAENVVAPHAAGIDGKQEDVAGEDD